MDDANLYRNRAPLIEVPFRPGLCVPALFKGEPFRLQIELVEGKGAFWLPDETRDGRDYWAIDLFEMVETADGPRRSPIESLDNQRWEVLDGDELVIRGVYRVEREALAAIRRLAIEVGCLPRPLVALEAAPRARASALAA